MTITGRNYLESEDICAACGWPVDECRCFKWGDEIEEGDVIVSIGVARRVVTIEPYRHPTLGETCGIARDHHGFAITLFANQRYQVA